MQLRIAAECGLRTRREEVRHRIRIYLDGMGLAAGIHGNMGLMPASSAIILTRLWPSTPRCLIAPCRYGANTDGAHIVSAATADVRPTLTEYAQCQMPAKTLSR